MSVIRRAAPLLLLAALAGCSPRGSVSPAAGIARDPEHLAHSIAALGFPGARRAFQAGAGCQVWNGEVALRWRLAGEPAGSASPVWFEADGVPIAHGWAVTASESLEFEAAASPRAELGDSSLELSVRVTAGARGGAPRELALEAVIAPDATGPSVRAWDAPDAPAPMAWRGRDVVRAGRVVARVPAGGACSAAGDSLIARWPRTLRAGERASWTFWLPAYPLPPGAPARARAHDDVAADARTRWRRLLGDGARLASGDERYDRLERAARVTLLDCLEREPEGLAPIGNPFQYRDVWLRDGSRALRALALCGYREPAREGARTLLEFQWPTGAILSQRGQLDGAGQALWLLDQVATHPPDSALAREWLPAAEADARWIERQCRMTRGLGLPWPGLLPYGDPRDGELALAPLVGNDAWAIAGEEAAADLAALAGRETTAAFCRGAAADLRASFAAALARERRPDVPPTWPGLGRDWGNFAVAFPTRALEPTHPRVAALLARVRAAGRGLASYGSPDSLHSYLGADLAMTALLAGRGAEAREYLDSLLAHSSSTLGQAEIFARGDGGFGRNLPPHATAAAAVIELTHALLAFERGDTLLLAAGLGAGGWRTASLERAPTRFGVLSARFARPAPDRFEARWQGVSAAVRLHVPEGFALVSLAGDPARDAGDGWVVAPPGSHAVTLLVRPAAGEGRR